ncbi:MAG: type 1 fimbrial protein [Providencia sp.]|jgi:type 1 fimbria pilin|nr:type 1 fimbrial protein [Providencia sp.]
MNRFLTFIVTLSLFHFKALAANSLDVEFRGILINTSCQIASESVNQKIILNNLRWQFINENTFSVITPFSIAIDKCSDTDIKKSVKLTWESNQLVNIEGVYYLSTKGSSGVFIGILDKEGKPIIWNKPMTVGEISVAENKQQFDFGVLVRKPFSEDVNVGDFSGTVTFSVEYE